MSAYIKKPVRSEKANYASQHLKTQEKTKQNQQKETVKIRVKINEIETKD